MKGIISAWGRILAGFQPKLSIEITRECPLTCPGCYAYGGDHLGGEKSDRQRVVEDLMHLRTHYPKLRMPKGMIESYVVPPHSTEGLYLRVDHGLRVGGFSKANHAMPVRRKPRLRELRLHCIRCAGRGRSPQTSWRDSSGRHLREFIADRLTCESHPRSDSRRAPGADRRKETVARQALRSELPQSNDDPMQGLGLIHSASSSSSTVSPAVSRAL
jgi:hypothetical protein